VTRRSARQCSSGGLDGVELVGLAVAAPLLAVRAVDLDHGDAGGGEMAGESGAVGAGPFDTDAYDRPEGLEQPARAWKPAGVVGNDSTPSSPPTDSIAAATCTSRWVSTPPVIGRVVSTTAMPSLS
jgi:hypothetical protein